MKAYIAQNGLIKNYLFLDTVVVNPTVAVKPTVLD